jgi:uncharacterized membrane protein
MNDRSLRLAAAALGLVGAGLMSYLLYVRYTGGAPICAGTGCEVVQRSRYAEVFGVPVAALGLAGFLTVVATSAFTGSRAHALQAGVVFSALGFSAYLLIVQLVVIGRVCDWCITGDGVTTALSAVVLLRLRSGSDAADRRRLDAGGPAGHRASFRRQGPYFRVFR